VFTGPASVGNSLQPNADSAQERGTDSDQPKGTFLQRKDVPATYVSNENVEFTHSVTFEKLHPDEQAALEDVRSDCLSDSGKSLLANPHCCQDYLEMWLHTNRASLDIRVSPAWQVLIEKGTDLAAGMRMLHSVPAANRPQISQPLLSL